MPTELVIVGWRSDTENWREAQNMPADQLPPLSEGQKKVARKLGISEEAYARSAYAGKRTQDRLAEKTRRLAEILQQKLQARHPGVMLNRIWLAAIEHRYYVELAVEGRSIPVRIEESLVDDLVEGGSAEVGRQIEQSLDRVLAGMAA